VNIVVERLSRNLIYEARGTHVTCEIPLRRG
jgi:hypothetical protein